MLITGGGTHANIVAGNYIGTDVTGSLDFGNLSNGVLINAGARFNRIGTDGSNDDDANTGGVIEDYNSSERNVVSGNNAPGVNLNNAGTDFNVIAGNYIGVAANGLSALANGGVSGVRIQGNAQNTLIGTNADGQADDKERNVISGNTSRGIQIDGASTNFNTVAGNYIGTNFTGDGAVANATGGILVSAGARFNTIGGLTNASRNVISGNSPGASTRGVEFNGTTTFGNVLTNNYIGTKANGTDALPNSGDGVTIENAPRNIIGGAGVGNLISGNARNGIFINGAASTGNVISGNRIGTIADGSQALPNGQPPIGPGTHPGIKITGATANLVGTNGDGVGDALERNLISGNGLQGVMIEGAGATRNVVAGNYVGTTADGLAALPNQSGGVLLSTGASANVIGVGGFALVAAEAVTVNVNPKNTYLRTDAVDTLAGPSQAIDISDLDIHPGDWILLEQLGDRTATNGGADTNIGLTGVFSSTTALDVPTALNRVINAIEAGVDVNTGNTLFDVQPTNITQDFSITATLIQVPAGALYLFVASPDSFNGDNTDPDGDFAVRITPLRAGMDAAAGNVISGNNGNGVRIQDVGTNANKIQGNIIGLAADGSTPRGNVNGVNIIAGSNNVIGGDDAADGLADGVVKFRNVISGNTANGVDLSTSGTNYSTLIQGNYIGTDITGALDKGNSTGIAVGSAGNHHWWNDGWRRQRHLGQRHGNPHFGH